MSTEPAFLSNPQRVIRTECRVFWCILKLSLSNSPERVGAIGPGALWDLGHWLIFANAYHEIGALNRPEGNKFVLRLQWLPSRKGSTDGHN